MNNTYDYAGTVTSILMMGSRIDGPASLNASVKAYFVAVLNALEEESTTWVYPSSKTNLKLTTGYPVSGPLRTDS